MSNTSGLSEATHFIDKIVAQLKTMVTRTSNKMVLPQNVAPSPQSSERPDFAKVFKSALDALNSAQTQSTTLFQNFALNKGHADLPDLMVAMQKASISLQTAVQVRNKLVAAYHDMMSMQL